MARTVAVVRADDLDGGPAAETVRFGIDGTNYEIDLSAEHTAALRQALAQFVAMARPTGRAREGAYPPPHGRPDAAKAGHVVGRGSSEQDTGVLAEMRQWARANGSSVGERGRIGREARQAFLATPPDVRAEQAVTFAELAGLGGTGSAELGQGAEGGVPRAQFSAAPNTPS